MPGVADADTLYDLCHNDDVDVGAWTVLRFLAIGSVTLYQVVQRMKTDGKLGQNPLVRLFSAGFEFAKNEGIGFLIYFAVSCCMDTTTIYLVNRTRYCAYVVQVAIYSMSLLTFLPNCWFASKYQGRYFLEGTMGKKAVFVFGMVALTVLSFLGRIVIVYHMGWADFIKSQLQDPQMVGRTVIAVAIPPFADATQTFILIMSGLKGAEHAYDNNKASPLLES